MRQEGPSLCEGAGQHAGPAVPDERSLSCLLLNSISKCSPGPGTLPCVSRCVTPAERQPGRAAGGQRGAPQQLWESDPEITSSVRETRNHRLLQTTAFCRRLGTATLPALALLACLED